MHICDVLIHVDETLDAQQRSSLEGAVREVDGVIAPRFNPGMDHLLLVAYNPERVGAAALLQKVRSAGYEASLIGG